MFVERQSDHKSKSFIHNIAPTHNFWIVVLKMLNVGRCLLTIKAEATAELMQTNMWLWTWHANAHCPCSMLHCLLIYVVIPKTAFSVLKQALEGLKALESAGSFRLYNTCKCCQSAAGFMTEVHVQLKPGRVISQVTLSTITALSSVLTRNNALLMIQYIDVTSNVFRTRVRLQLQL